MAEWFIFISAFPKNTPSAPMPHPHSDSSFQLNILCLCIFGAAAHGFKDERRVLKTSEAQKSKAGAHTNQPWKASFSMHVCLWPIFLGDISFRRVETRKLANYRLRPAAVQKVKLQGQYLFCEKFLGPSFPGREWQPGREITASVAR